MDLTNPLFFANDFGRNAGKQVRVRKKAYEKKLPALPGQGGFTLFEVIVSVFIMGTALVVLMGLFSGGLRLAKKSGDMTEVVLFAREKMTEALNGPASEGVSSGSVPGWSWKMTTEPFANELAVNKFHKVTLSIMRDGAQDASYSVSAFRAVEETAAQ